MSEPAYTPTVANGPSGLRSGFWRRFAAALLDGIVVGVIGYVLSAILGLDRAGDGLGLLLSLAYYTYLEGSSGQTLGKKALGIRVVDLVGGGPIGFGRAFVRWIGRFVSALVFFLGYFWMIWDKEKQTWHDKFAGSVVVPDSAVSGY
jgi:uncharacterized RDD family membrane protein YckC